MNLSKSLPLIFLFSLPELKELEIGADSKVKEWFSRFNFPALEVLLLKLEMEK